MNNPYANALEGLTIKDPVKSFFDWCKERETIREKRDSGKPYPWTDDLIFRQGRFLNTFRENDKGSRAIIKFCKPVCQDQKKLIHALFFARWCNHHTTLDTIHADHIQDIPTLKSTLLSEVEQPWYSSVYPVEKVCWKGEEYDRFEACTDLFPRIIGFLEDCILKARGQVTSATDYINREFRMSNDFPIFMAVIDISWFMPQLIDPNSPVPTGIGATPYLDILQDYLGTSDHHTTALKMIELQDSYWPSAKRRFSPVDIEYISCECRKYFSYINGTKEFVGKNLFTHSQD